MFYILWKIYYKGSSNVRYLVSDCTNLHYKCRYSMIPWFTSYHNVCHILSQCVSHPITMCVTSYHNVCHILSQCVSHPITMCVTSYHNVCYILSQCVSHPITMCVTSYHNVCHILSQCVSLKSIYKVQCFGKQAVDRVCMCGFNCEITPIMSNA